MNNLVTVSILAWLALLFFSCGDAAEKIRVRVEMDAIFVDNKKVVNTADIAEQEGLTIEALDTVLKAKRLEEKKKNKELTDEIQMQIDPNQSYSMLFKTMATFSSSGFTNISFTSKINGKKYTEKINLPERGDFYDANPDPCSNGSSNLLKALAIRRRIKPPDENCLNLTVSIGEDSLEIWARGGSLPKIPFQRLQENQGLLN